MAIAPGTENGSSPEGQLAKLLGGRAAVCPYLEDGPAACYCRHITSQTAPLIVRYCGGAYQECRYYREEELGYSKK